MKKIVNVALGAALCFLLAATAQPVLAACGGAPILSTIGSASQSRIITDGQPTAGYAPPLINPQGYFWSLGGGNPVVGPGDDNGAFPAWSAFDSAAGAAGQEWLPIKSFMGNGYYFSTPVRINTTWAVANPPIDGCLFNQGPPISGPCTCMLLTDTNLNPGGTAWWGYNGNFDGHNPFDGDKGFFALVTGRSDALGDTFMNDPLGAPIVLREIPAPQVLASNKNAGNNNLDLIRVRVDVPANAIYDQGGCLACLPSSYLVYQQIVPRLAGDPQDRDKAASWQLMQEVGPVAQTPTAVGNTVDLVSACGGANNDVWLTAELLFDSGYDTIRVGTSSTRIECGPMFTDPGDDGPVRKPSRTVRPKQDRGGRGGR